VHHIDIMSTAPSQLIRYNGRMNRWDKAWPLYAAAVAIPVAFTVGLWFFGMWLGG
jgi:hypothetical protein